MEGYSDPLYEDLLFHKAPVAMAFVSRDGKFQEVNEAFSELVGYSQSELAGRHFASITHPDDVEMDRTEANILLSNPESDGYKMLKRYISKDGRSVWCRLCVAALRKEGQFVRYITHALDLPLANSYKVEQTSAGVSVRPSIRWIDILRDNPRESVLFAIVTGAIFKVFDISVVHQVMDVLTAWGKK